MSNLFCENVATPKTETIFPYKKLANKNAHSIFTSLTIAAETLNQLFKFIISSTAGTVRTIDESKFAAKTEDIYLFVSS